MRIYDPNKISNDLKPKPRRVEPIYSLSSSKHKDEYEFSEEAKQQLEEIKTNKKDNTMSGCVGAERITSKENYNTILEHYKKFISNYPNFKSIRSSGSIVSDPTKTSFGDMDLIIEVKGFSDKKLAKLDFVDWVMTQSEESIVPFCSEKYNGRVHLNTGELITIAYQSPDKSIPFAQIDNIFALTEDEAIFKESFLNIPAAKQGLILGLVKVFVDYFGLFQVMERLKIKEIKGRSKGRIVTNLSSGSLTVRDEIYDPITSKVTDKTIIWQSTNWNDVINLLKEFDLSLSFEELLAQIKEIITDETIRSRVFGVLNSMVSVKSGEIGTPKGAEKERCISLAEEVLLG